MDCTVDEFLVDELLDFSNNCSTENEEHPQGYNGKKPEKVEAENVTNLSGKQDFGELHFPVRTIFREKKLFFFNYRN